MRTLLLLALLLPTALSAQTTDSFGIAAFTAQSDEARTGSLIGTYASDDATLHVARTGRSLVLTLVGQTAFDAFAEVTGNPTFNVRAEALLRDAFAGSTHRLSEALPVQRREAGTRDFSRLLVALTERRGAVESVDALGTTGDAAGLAATYVRVRFADGEELLKLKWRDGRLALITRGVLPYVTAHPVRGSTRRFAVLDATGAPSALVVFGDTQVTVRGSAHTLVAARDY